MTTSKFGVPFTAEQCQRPGRNYNVATAEQFATWNTTTIPIFTKLSLEGFPAFGFAWLTKQASNFKITIKVDAPEFEIESLALHYRAVSAAIHALDSSEFETRWVRHVGWCLYVKRHVEGAAVIAEITAFHEALRQEMLKLLAELRTHLHE